MDVPPALPAIGVVRHACVYFDSANQIHAIRAGDRRRPVVTSERIVIGNGERFETDAPRGFDQFGRRIRSVRFVRMGVQVNHSSDSKSNVSPATWTRRWPGPSIFPAAWKKRAPSVDSPDRSLIGAKTIAD